MPNNEPYKLGKHGGPRRPGNANTDVVRHRGTSRSYILARLEREGLTDWIDAILAGKISAYGAATHFGWVTRPPTLSGEDSNQSRRRRWAIRAIV